MVLTDGFFPEVLVLTPTVGLGVHSYMAVKWNVIPVETGMPAHATVIADFLSRMVAEAAALGSLNSVSAIPGRQRISTISGGVRV